MIGWIIAGALHTIGVVRAWADEVTHPENDDFKGWPLATWAILWPVVTVIIGSIVVIEELTYLRSTWGRPWERK
jgi:hypothetical protein